MDLKEAQYDKSNNQNKKQFVLNMRKRDVHMARCSYGAIRKT